MVGGEPQAKRARTEGADHRTRGEGTGTEGATPHLDGELEQVADRRGQLDRGDSEWASPPFAIKRFAEPKFFLHLITALINFNALNPSKA